MLFIQGDFPILIIIKNINIRFDRFAHFHQISEFASKNDILSHDDELLCFPDLPFKQNHFLTNYFD